MREKAFEILVRIPWRYIADGCAFSSGNTFFKFIEGTPQSKFDNLFEANGPRFLRIYPDILGVKMYLTIKTPR